MIEEKAIKILEHTKRNCGLPEQGDIWKPNAETIALDMAINALERQIAKKPKPYMDAFTGRISHECDECGNDVQKFLEHPYCKWCGQKIDWSDEE